MLDILNQSSLEEINELHIETKDAFICEDGKITWIEGDYYDQEN